MRIAWLALALVLVSASGAARAQELRVDPFDTSAARALFQEGVELARAGDYEAASDRFRRARALRPSPSVAFNLASALIHLGRLVEAYETFESVVRDPSSTPEMRDAARLQREQVMPRLAWLRVRVDGDDVGVVLDGHSMHAAALDVSIPVDPGHHDVRASREAAVIVHEPIDLIEGESRELMLMVPRPLPDADARAVPATAMREDDVATPAAHGDDGPWIALGVIAGVLAAGAIATVAVGLTLPGAPVPVGGNTVPAILTW